MAGAGALAGDAIVVAAGLLAGCAAIVTNDHQWQRRLASLYRQFRRIYLSSCL